MGVRFDETLAVVEDWDVILETALLCGVTNNPDVTSLYRRWLSAHSSFAIHSKDEWHRSRDKILARFDQRTLPMPPGTLSDYHRLYDEVVMRRKMTDHLIFERNTARNESSGRAKEISKLAARLHTTTIERILAVEQGERTQTELERIRATMSWRMMKPFRGFRQTVRRLIKPRR
jgi:hypothetical protein